MIRDYSGRGNDGTLTNMDPETDWVNDGGYALDFKNTASQYLSVPTKGLSTNAFMVSMWFKLDVWSDYDNLLEHSTDGVSANRVTLERDNNWMGAAQDIGLGTTNGVRLTLNAAGSVSLHSVTQFTTGVWYHLAAGWSADKTVFLYVNGQPDATGTALWIPSAWGTYIGFAEGFISSRFINGQMDSIDLYNRDSRPLVRTLSKRRGISQETTEVSPYTTQWGSVAAAFQPAWGASATTIAGVASGQ